MVCLVHDTFSIHVQELLELASCTHLGIRRQLLDIVSLTGTVLHPDQAGLTVCLILLGEAVAPLVHLTAHGHHA